jgi:hypothetical protein
MPYATANGAHGESTTKVIEDYPRAICVVRVRMKEKTRAHGPWIPGMICVCHGSGFFKLEEGKGYLRMRARCQWSEETEESEQIAGLGPA